MKKVKVVALTAIPAIVVAAALFFTGYLYIQSKEPVPNLPATQTVQAPTTVPLNADTIFNLVNQERIKAGVKPLIRDARLDGSAQQKASDMNYSNYFSHVNPDTAIHGYELIPDDVCKYRSENISHYMPPYAGNGNIIVVGNWYNSKSHHDAMLDPKYDISGIAISGDKIVQHFCDLK